MATATPRLMGAEVKRKEDPRLITGTSTYVGDLNIPGLHYVAFVRSPHAHANVGGIDTSAAMKRPGVFKVVTGEDLRAALPAHTARWPQRGRRRRCGHERRAAALSAVDRPRALCRRAGGGGDRHLRVGGRGRSGRRDGRLGAPARGGRSVRGHGDRRAPALRRCAEEHRARDAHQGRRARRRLRQGTQGGEAAHGEPAAVRRAHGAAGRARHAGSRLGRPHSLVDHPGAARAAQRHRHLPRPRAEPGAGDRAGGGRRLRRQVRHLRRRRDPRRGGPALPRARALDGDARRAHDVDHARSRAGDRSRGRGGGRRHHHRPSHARHRGHRRVSDLHLHPRPHPPHGRGRLQGDERRSQVDLRLHQLHAGGRLSRRGAAGGGLLSRAADRRDRRRAGQAARRRSGGRTSSRPPPSPTPRPPARSTTAASTTAPSGKRWRSRAIRSCGPSRRSG